MDADYNFAAAKRLLVHYFRLCMTGAELRWDSDNESEIGEIVDLIRRATIQAIDERSPALPAAAAAAAPGAPGLPAAPGKQTLDGFLYMARAGDYVVLDTETTGLKNAEIVEIAVVDFKGRVLLNEFVKPVRPIPASASNIHGITDDMVLLARNWAEVSAELQKVIAGRHVIIYNAAYDLGVMASAGAIAGLPFVDWKKVGRFWCCMEAFAEVFGQWDEYHKSFTWKKLEFAAEFYNLRADTAHRALGDVNTTLAITRHMADFNHAATTRPEDES
jgi:DNA polymerase III epsilon subunit-like protein